MDPSRSRRTLLQEETIIGNSLMPEISPTILSAVSPLWVLSPPGVELTSKRAEIAVSCLDPKHPSHLLLKSHVPGGNIKTTSKLCHKEKYYCVFKVPQGAAPHLQDTTRRSITMYIRCQFLYSWILCLKNALEILGKTYGCSDS